MNACYIVSTAIIRYLSEKRENEKTKKRKKGSHANTNTNMLKSTGYFKCDEREVS